jgi:hypothetical protein
MDWSHLPNDASARQDNRTWPRGLPMRVLVFRVRTPMIVVATARLTLFGQIDPATAPDDNRPSRS